MDVKEVLKLADRLVFAKTDEHLDDLQEAVVRGTWQGKRYSKIAEEFHCTEGHVRNVASELWQILSELLGEELNKSNFRSTLERWQFTNSNVSNFVGKDFIQIGRFSVCGETLQSPNVPYPPSHTDPSPTQENAKPQTQQDLRDAPDVSSFYDRTEELTSLEKSIVQDRCRLIALLGISGIGKTAIALQLVKQIQDNFECIIWRSLRYSPPLEVIQRNLIQFLSDRLSTELPATPDERRSLLLECLRSRRSLIILDDVQMILSSGQLAGNYRLECEYYSTFFKLLGEVCHNSCLLLLSSEPPREITALSGENAPVRLLQLDGLGIAAVEIFREKGLLDEDKWPELINTYRGNPLWLKIVARMIRELFKGRVAEFLKYDKLFLGEELVALLRQQFHRLSELEKAVMSCIASQAEPVSISQLIQEIERSPSELFSAIQSLGRRSLIEQPECDNETLVTLSPVMQQLLKTQSPKP